MRDFDWREVSLIHGRARGWLPVLLIGAVALVVVLSTRSPADGGPCPAGAVAIGADDPRCATLPGQPELLGGVGDVDLGATRPAGLPTGATDPTAGTTAGSTADGDPGAGVPFVSLQPSPEPMTEAGEELVREATAERERQTAATDGP